MPKKVLLLPIDRSTCIKWPPTSYDIRLPSSGFLESKVSKSDNANFYEQIKQNDDDAPTNRNAYL